MGLKDKKPEVVYLIYRKGLMGLSSVLGGVLGHLKIAEESGLIPVVDMETYPTYYSESAPVFGTRNAWEYYFDPVSSISPKDAYRSHDWIDSLGNFPHDITSTRFSEESWMKETYDKYICLRPETQSALNQYRNRIEPGSKTLGVHFRGTDMKTEPHHPLPPSKAQMFRKIDYHLSESDFDGVYLVTEDESYVESFLRRYGSERLKFLGIPREGKVKIFKEYPRSNHRYLQGLESLIETHLLAECGGIICGHSGQSEFALLLANHHQRVVEKIYNGVVPGNKFLAKYAYLVKSRAPRGLGGFKR